MFHGQDLGSDFIELHFESLRIELVIVPMSNESASKELVALFIEKFDKGAE